MSKEKNLPKNKLSSSFRDPCGYIYFEEGIMKRAILPKYFNQYNALKKTGFFEKVIKLNLLIPHKEFKKTDDFISITPEKIPFISYPYEWSFEQYKDAALHTLKLQKYAVINGFILKDASAFNIFFHNGRPVFIDTLSFDFYKKDSPWRAFKMFVTHFLSPLVLAHYYGASMLKLMQSHIDGIPLQLTSSLLPWYTKFNPVLFTNIHLMARMEHKYQKPKDRIPKKLRLNKKNHLKHLDLLYSYIQNLKIKQKTEWGEYYKNNNYNSEAYRFKTEQLVKWVSTTNAKKLLDVGGNDGTMARHLIDNMESIIVGDVDANAVDQNYKKLKRNRETNITPLVFDILNPNSNLGYNNTERQSILERFVEYKPDVTFALALIHHIALSGNVPFEKIASFFSQFSKTLIIEFPQRDDAMVQLLINQKMEFKNHFDFYNLESFEKCFKLHFHIEQKIKIPNSNRVLFLMSKNG